MTRDQKRRAIEGPVAVGGANVSPRLVQQLLNDLGDNPDQLPILQHALMRTWSYWAQHKDYEDEVLDLKHYEAIGTMSEALSQHANEAYDELDDEQKRICEIMFKAITEKRGENFGIRRPTRLNEIAAIADVSEADVIAVIEKFREPGRSLLTPAYGTPLGPKSMVDISHESLMRIWVRLKNWVDDEAEAVQMYQRLAEAASQYQVGKAGLWRPPDLQLALNWQAKHKPTLVWGQRYHPAFERTMIFLEYSKKEFDTEQRIKELEAKRRLQRARVIALVLGAFLVVALIAFVYALVQQTAAVKAQKEAVANAERANKEKIEADRQRGLAVEAKKLADVNAEKARLNAIEAKKNAGAALKQQKLAEQNAERATQQEKIAKDNADRATTAQKLAEQNEAKAKAEEAKAQRERYLATAKAMAIKSKELSDPEQEGLLAQQAYNFNTKYTGYEFNNDVYNGLYAALKKYDFPLTRSLEGHKNSVRSLVTSASSNTLFSGGSDGKIMRWSLQNGAWKGDVLVGERDDYQVYSMDVSPDGNYLVVGGLFAADRNTNYAELYDLRNLGPARKIMGYKSDIENINFTPDGKGFYARCNSGRSILYSDLTTAREVISLKEKITSIDLSPDGTKLAGAGSAGHLYIWDIRNNYTPTDYHILKGTDILAVSFTPDNRDVIIGDENGEVRIVTNGITRRILSGHTSQIAKIKFSHSGKFMATASKDKTIRLWNYHSLKDQPQVMLDHDWVWSMAFTPDDSQIIAGIHSIRENVKDKDFTIHAWPTKISAMATVLCSKLTRNMTKDDWDSYVAEDLPYESTCPNLPANNK
jgi:WD40 repeat protein